MDDTTLTILLVDPNVLFRSGIARLLESQPDLKVVGETGECMEAVRLATDLRPAVILMEIEVDGCDGPGLAGLIAQEFDDIHLVFLTTHTDAKNLFSCILSGADGYLQKNITPDELFARLRGLKNGEAAISLTTVKTLMDQLSSSNYALRLRTTPHTNLTPRECEVLSLVARGMTNKDIGAVLNISEHTVRNHLCSIYQKLKLRNRLQVAVYSVMHGLVDLESIGSAD
jgi:two-component system nitrate/nitrite response regulator NarL